MEKSGLEPVVYPSAGARTAEARVKVEVEGPLPRTNPVPGPYPVGDREPIDPEKESVINP